MKIVLLAGGQSKRVKPLPDKCFVKICGKYLIELQLKALEQLGCPEVVIVANHSNVEKLRQLHRGVVVEQEDKDGMIWGILAAKDHVMDEDAVVIVSSNDVVDEMLWQEVYLEMGQCKKRKDDGFLVGYKVSRYFPGGYLKINDFGHLQSIVEKPGEGNEPSDLVNLVIHFHRDVRALYEAIENEKRKTENEGKDDHYEQALQQLFSDGKLYSVLPYSGFWQAIKYPWHLLRLMDFYLEKLQKTIAPDAEIAKTAVVNGDVVIESGVKIFDHAVINGPAYIGKGSIIGNHALVRSSSLGTRCAVGHTTEVARSLLQDEVFLHNNYIGDSLVGNNVAFGSGTVTGNLRLDEGEISVNILGKKTNTRRTKLGLITGDNIRVGINTSFMPGVKVGSNSMIGAGLSISEDVEEGKFFKKEGDIRENTRQIGRRA